MDDNDLNVFCFICARAFPEAGTAGASADSPRSRYSSISFQPFLDVFNTGVTLCGDE